MSSNPVNDDEEMQMRYSNKASSTDYDIARTEMNTRAPPFSMMALAAVEESKEDEGMEHSLALEQQGIGTHRTEPEPIHPGAVAVAGFDENEGNDGTVFIGDEECSTALESYNSRHPVTAHIVEENEDERRILEEQLQQREEELQRMLAERENVAVAQVILTEQEAPESDEASPHHRFSIGLCPLKNEITHACGQTIWWIVVIGMILVIFGIVLSVALPRILSTELTSVSEPTSAPPPRPIPQDLTDLLSSVSFDSGVALSTPSTPQSDALNWLADNTNLQSYSNETKVQRYVLATLYYSTNGDNWYGNVGWLNDSNECTDWWNDAEGPFCSSDGAIVELDLYNGDSGSRGGNNLNGKIPEEIGLLSNALGKYLLGIFPIQFNAFSDIVYSAS